MLPPGLVKSRVIEQAKFTYYPLRKALVLKQIKAIKDQYIINEGEKIGWD